MLFHELARIHDDLGDYKIKISDAILQLRNCLGDKLPSEREWLNKELTGYGGKIMAEGDKELNHRELEGGVWGRFENGSVKSMDYPAAKNMRIVCSMGIHEIENQLGEIFGEDFLKKGRETIVRQVLSDGSRKHAISMEHRFPTDLQYLVPPNAFVQLYVKTNQVICAFVKDAIVKLGLKP